MTECCKLPEGCPLRCEKTAEAHAAVKAVAQRATRELDALLPQGMERVQETEFWAHAAVTRGCKPCGQVPGC